MDLFHEESVHKVDTGMNTILFVLSYVGIFLFGFIAMQFLLAILGGGLTIPAVALTLVFAGLAYGSFVLRNNQRIEYDYTFTNGIFDIAKVINNTKRKKLLTTNIKDFEVLAPTSDPGFKKMLNHPGIKKYNFFLNKGGGLYYGVFNHEGAKSLLVIEPSDEMIKLFKTINPRNVKMI